MTPRSDPILQASELREVAALAREYSGIELDARHVELVRSRLGARLRQLRLGSYSAYVRYVRTDETGSEKSAFVDALSTNLTSFMREPAHFDHLRDDVVGGFKAAARIDRPSLRIWSAACSTGEEPYSAACVVAETLPDLAGWDVRILGTDISRTALATATVGRYPERTVAGLGPLRIERHFDVERARRGESPTFVVAPSVRRLVTFARLNLLDPWPMRGRFDAIFCRNVMIYFGAQSRHTLMRRLVGALRPGGVLYVGHSDNVEAPADLVDRVGSATFVRRPESAAGASG